MIASIPPGSTSAQKARFQTLSGRLLASLLLFLTFLPFSQLSASVGYIRITTISLSPAAVGSSYSAAISLQGGTSPYQFTVSRGVLPPGLVLDPTTGGISGTPSVSGTFAFTLLVTDAPRSDRGDKRLSITVNGNEGIGVSISPTSATLNSGHTQQFTASVSGTSQTTVTWSASAGTMSSSGLFTAPTVSVTTSVTVRATSTAAPTQNAAAIVTVNPVTQPPGLRITTTALPPGTVGTAYLVNLSASGGTSPYRWSLLTGTLPGGFTLASSGAISGSSTLIGTYPLTVQVQDSANNTASAALSLQITTAASCGPPTYNCSRSDLIPAPNPLVPPQVGPNACSLGSLTSCGNLTGANTVVTDPDFSNRIVRVTDAQSCGGGTCITATSGAPNANMWNQDSTRFVVESLGATAFLYGFNPNSMQATRLGVIGTQFSGSSGWSWSFTNPNILFAMNSTKIWQFDLTGYNGGSLPNPTLVFDFNNATCLQADPNWSSTPKATWRSAFFMSTDDQSFVSGFSNAGGQGTGIFSAFYTIGSGCRLLDSQSGMVYGDWGARGPINVSFRWATHENGIGRSGNWGNIGFTKCLSGTCPTPPYFWDLATTTITPASGCLSGHEAHGHTHWMNYSQCTHLGQDTIRAFSSLATPVSNITSYPIGMITPFDQHFSWNNVDLNDSYAYISSSWTPQISPLPTAWYNEILGTFPANVGNVQAGTVKRFAHSFISAVSQRFNTKYAIGHVSQDGRFFMFSSDWLGTLGSETGAPNCTLGADCRGDVFIVELD